MRTFAVQFLNCSSLDRDSHLQMAETIMGIRVNCSPMLPELFDKYPHREEDRKIDVATLFL